MLKWAGLLLLGGIVACDSDPHPRRYFGRADSIIRPPGSIANGRLPASCVDSVAETREMVLLSRITPEDMSRSPSAVDSGWFPAGLDDVVPVGSGFIAMDSKAARLWWLAGADLSLRRSWGARGAGPQEFKRPIAVARLPNSSEVVVFDVGLGRLSYYDVSGGFTINRNVPSAPAGPISVDRRGDVYFAKAVWGKSAPFDSTAQVLVARLGRGDTEPVPFIRVAAGDIGPPRFVLPGPNPVQIRSLQDRLAILFPAAGFVELYDAHGGTVTVRTCIPDGIMDVYAKQLSEATAETRQQSWVALVSDVFLTSDGKIHVVGPMKDQEGRYHVDRFGPDGSPIGSIVAQADSVTLFGNVRFGAGPHELIGFHHDGSITIVRLRELGRL